MQAQLSPRPVSPATVSCLNPYVKFVFTFIWVDYSILGLTVWRICPDAPCCLSKSLLYVMTRAACFAPVRQTFLCIEPCRLEDSVREVFSQNAC